MAAYLSGWRRRSASAHVISALTCPEATEMKGAWQAGEVNCSQVFSTVATGIVYGFELVGDVQGLVRRDLAIDDIKKSHSLERLTGYSAGTPGKQTSALLAETNSIKLSGI